MDIVKKYTKEVYRAYGRDFNTEYEAITYAYQYSSQQLNTLLKELDHMMGRKNISDILKHNDEFLLKLGTALQEHRAICLLKVQHRPIEGEP